MVTLEQYIKDNLPSLPLTKLHTVLEAGELVRLRRKEKILQEGSLFQYKIFLQSGLLRNYMIAENGQEHILKFTDAGDWCTDPESFYEGIPSKYNIEAIEPSELIVFKKAAFDILRERVAELNVLTEKIMAENAQASQNRMLLTLSATPEEKYLNFMEKHTEIFSRVPLHMVASYLGLSRETLTRVRQNLWSGTAFGSKESQTNLS